MEQAAERGRSVMRYAVPVIGAAIPAAVMLARRAFRRPRPGESKERMLLRRSNLDLQGAMNAALKYVPGTPVEVELEEEHGMPVWEVQVVPRKGGPTREVLVDAKTGDILEMKAEFPKEPEAEA